MANERKSVKIGDLFTDSEVRQAAKCKSAREIADKVITPIIGRVNAAAGQECDPMYLAYALEYAISQVMFP